MGLRGKIFECFWGSIVFARNRLSREKEEKKNIPRISFHAFQKSPFKIKPFSLSFFTVQNILNLRPLLNIVLCAVLFSSGVKTTAVFCESNKLSHLHQQQLEHIWKWDFFFYSFSQLQFATFSPQRFYTFFKPRNFFWILFFWENKAKNLNLIFFRIKFKLDFLNGRE